MVSTKSLHRVVFMLLLTLSFVTAMPAHFIGSARAAQTTTVTIADLAFDPQNVTIKVGSTITWTNNGSLIHSLWFVKTNDQTTYKKAGTEGLSDPILPDTVWSQTFDEIITLQYYSFPNRLWVTGFISVVPLASPVASFTYTPNEPLVGQTVAFNASESYDQDGTITSYAWDFGEGTTLTRTDPLATHIYTENGNYNVALAITDEDGLTDSAWTTIAILPVHDIAVTGVSPSPTEVASGENVTITVDVKNEGTVAETFNVKVYFNNTLIDTQTVTALVAGSSETLEFVWDTSNAAEGTYIIKAEAATVMGETDVDDNVLLDVTVTVKGVPFVMFPYIWIIIILIAVALVSLGAYIYLRRMRISKS
jgi:PKD repeat protein